MNIFSKMLNKKVLIILFILLFLLIAGIGVLLINLGKIIESNKDRILVQAEQAVGRKVSVENLRVKIWPSVSITLEKFAFADDPQFSPENFLSAEDLQIHFKLWPLLQKKLEISQFTLHKPVVHLIQNSSGAFNYSSLMKPTQNSTDSSATTNPDAKSSEMVLSLAQFALQNGTIIYSDKKNKTEFRLDQLDLSVQNFALDQSFPVTLDAALLASKQNFHFNGEVGPLRGAESTMAINAILDIQSLPWKTLVSLPIVKSSIPPSAKLDGTADANFAIKGSLNSFTFSGKMNASHTQITYGDYFNKIAGTPMQIDLNSQYASDTWTISSLAIQTPGLPIQGQGKITFAKSFAYDFSLHSEEADLASLQSVLPILKTWDTAGKVSLNAQIQSKGKMNIQGSLTFNDVQVHVEKIPNPISKIHGKIDFTAQNAMAKDISCQIGQSSLKITSNVISFAPLSLKYELDSPSLQFRDIVMAPEGMKDDVLKNLHGSGSLDRKNSLTAKGAISSDQGVFYGIAYTNLKSDYSLENSVFSLPDLAIDLLKGSSKVKMTIDYHETPPKFDLDTQLQNIDVLDFVRSHVIALPEMLQGKADLNLNLNGSGLSWEAIQPTLQGKFDANISKGMLLNVNLAESVLGGLAGMPGVTDFLTSDIKTQYPQIFDSQHTVFDQFKITAVIDKGEINFKDLLISAADWAIDGNGILNFNEGLKSDALLQLSKNFSGYLTQKAKFLQYLQDDSGNITIPFAVNGVLPNIKSTPNKKILQGFLEKAVMGKVTNKLNLKGLPEFSNLLPSVKNAAPPSASASPEVQSPTPFTPQKLLSPFQNLFK